MVLVADYMHYTLYIMIVVVRISHSISCLLFNCITFNRIYANVQIGKRDWVLNARYVN